MTTFADSDARTHIKTAPNAHMFVEAGAGTGKTTEMVGRIVELLASGQTQIEAIVAITFTEAAAGELRERLRSALERRRASGSAQESERCQEALTNLEDAAIQTIHGFAHRIVSRFAVEVGVPPSFELQDRIKSKLLADQRWMTHLQRMLLTMEGLNEDERDVIRVGTALGLNQGHLAGFVNQLSRRWYRCVPLADAPIGSFGRVDVAPLMKAIDAVNDGFAQHCTDASDTLCAWKQDTLDPWVEELRLALNDPDEFAVVELFGRAPSLSFGNSRGAKGKWHDVEVQRDLILNMRAVKDQVFDQPRQFVLRGLLTILAKYVVGEAEHRRVNGTLDFDDLLVYSLELVRRRSVAALLRQSYRYIFVDEFQDTDDLQVELINALVRSDGDEDGAHLFTVGDPKQSIYRFRGADLDQFRNVRNNGRADVTQLTTNFRTVTPIVDWVNAVFEPLLTGTADKWTALDIARSEELGGVQIIGDVVEGVRARDVREIEAREVVENFVKAKHDGWLIKDGATERPIRYGDMAVLMPARRSLPSLERELRRAQVPYRVESRSLIWSTQEIRDLTAILKAVSDPRNEVALFASLRTAALACGDDDLLAWKRAGRSWSYLDDIPDGLADSPVAQAMVRLRTLHGQHRWMSVSQFVSQVAAEMRMYELAFARTRQREAWHRLRFVVDRARAWVDDGNSGLHGFVQWIETQEAEAADAIETVVAESDDDAVRVMTIHASKGLEFPLVALVGLGSRDSVTDSARILWDANFSCQLRIGSSQLGWNTPGFKEADLANAEDEAAEQARLLYVAATRARDHLVVSLYRLAPPKKAGGRESLAQRLANVLGERVELTVPARPAEAAAPVVTRPAVEAPSDRRMRRASVVKRASRNLSMSATGISNGYVGITGALPSYASGSADVEANDLAERITFGSAAHSALEEIPLEASPELVLQVAEQKAEEFKLLHRTADIAQSVRNALGSHHVRRALASGRWWREVPVYNSHGEMVIGGTIDLLYEVDGELVIVDYKTEEVKDEAARQHALARYQWQLTTYAYVCAQTTGKKVREAALLFIPPSADAAVNVPVEPLNQLVERLTDEVLPELFVV